LFVTDGTANGIRALFTFENSGIEAPPISELTHAGTHLFVRGLPQLGRGALFAMLIVPEPGNISLIALASIAIIGSTRRFRR
jgi:hypothetical protein